MELNETIENNGLTIKDGDVVISESEKEFILVMIKKDKRIKFGRQLTVLGSDIIGKYYETTYKFDKFEQSLILHTGWVTCSSDNTDNQEFQLNEEIQPEEEHNTDMLMNAINRNESFKDKTSFAQQKYINKKRKKFTPIVIFHKPTAFYLSSFYSTLFPYKILHIQPHVLGQILYHASFSSDSHVACFENTQGLLSGAILSRLTSGYLLQVYNRDFSDNILKQYQLACPFNHIKVDITQDSQNCLSIYFNSCHSLIIASKYQPLQLLCKIYPLLKPSFPFVIFSSYVEPLKECYQYLKDSGAAYELTIENAILREIKVEMAATRPLDSTNGHNNYILHGYKLI